MKESTILKLGAAAVAITAAATLGPTIAIAADTDDGITAKTMTDALHTVMAADRKIYTKLIISRLAKKEKVITASEHWKDEKALVLPAQMFRYASEEVSKKDPGFSYTLLSKWPINKQNAAKTDVEKEGLDYVAANPGKNFYKKETLGKKNYFTAIYADTAVSPACVSCHNKHKDTPKSDFKLGQVMGGVVIRVPLK